MIIGLDRHLKHQPVKLGKLSCKLTGYYQLHAGRYYWQLLTPDKSVVWSKHVDTKPLYQQYEVMM
jgi:hypothetical protein